ncbi:MAG: MarR family transcriptional regulator, partial [Clostridia bacterium]|nr:MarR family transcriptional regulator [Clostridia bacterium]
ELEEQLILAWVKLTGTLKNTRITQGMIYNEAIVMMIAYNRFREDGEGLVSFKEIVSETKMLKSLVNRTIDSLVKKNFLERCEGKDKRTTFVRPVKENLSIFLAVHDQSLTLAHNVAEVIGREDAEAFVRLSRKICESAPLI